MGPYGPIWARAHAGPGPPGPGPRLLGRMFFEKRTFLKKCTFFLGLGTYFTRIGPKFRAGECNRFVKWSHMCREMAVFVFVPNMCI